jgi:tetratricopeptide (TPR) repeat protein
LTTDVLAKLEAGMLDDAAGARAFAHLGSCPTCQEFHREFFATAQVLKSLPQEILDAQPRPEAWDRIRARLAEPAPAGELPVPLGPISIACTYCKGKLPRKEAVYCAGCLAPHHGACWEEHGRCAACAVTQLVRAEESRKPREARPGRRVLRTFLVAGLASALGAAAFTIGQRVANERLGAEVRDTSNEARALMAKLNAEHERNATRLEEALALTKRVRKVDENVLAELVAAVTTSAEQTPDERRSRRAALGEFLERLKEEVARGARPISSERLLDAAKELREWERRDLADEAWDLCVAVDPANFDAWLFGAKHNVGTGKMSEKFAKALALRPDSLEAHLSRGVDLLSDKKYDEAELDFRFVLERASQAEKLSDEERALVGEAHRSRAEIAHARGNADAALEELAAAIKLAPEDPLAYHTRAVIELEALDLEKAIADERAAIAHEPDPDATYEFHCVLGRALDWSLDERDAIAELTTGTAHGGVTTVLDTAKDALCAILARRADRVLVLDETARRNPTATLGDLFAESGAERARRESEALKAFADHDAHSLDLVHLLLGKKDLTAAKHILEERTTDSGLKKTAEEECVRGQLALLEKDWELAAAHFESALALDKESAFATAGLATAYKNHVGESEARSLFAKARALEAREGKTSEETYFWAESRRHARLAERFLDASEFAKALAALTRVLARNPLHALARLERARLLAAFHSWDLAVEEASAAVEADPFFADGHLFLGRLYSRELPEWPSPLTQRPKNVRASKTGADEIEKALALVETDDARIEAALEVTGQGADSPEAAIRAIETAADQVAPDFPDHVSDASLPAERVARTILVLERACAQLHDLANLGGSELVRLGRVWRQVSSSDQETFAEKALATAKLRLRIQERAREASRDAVEKARVLARTAGGEENALDLLDRALVLDPDATDARFKRGTLLARLGHPAGATRELAVWLEASLNRGAVGFYDALDRMQALLDEKPVPTLLAGPCAGSAAEPETRLVRAFATVVRAGRGQDVDLAAAQADLKALEPSRLRGLCSTLLADAAVLRAPTPEARAKAIEHVPAEQTVDILSALVQSLRSQDPDLDDAGRKQWLDLAVGTLSRTNGLAPAWDRAQKEPGFAPLRDDPRVQAIIESEKERAASAERLPVRMLALGRNGSDPCGPTIQNVWWDERNFPGDPARRVSRHSSPGDYRAEVLEKDAALLLAPKALPKTEAELERYDIIILSAEDDVPAECWSPEFQAQLKAAVEGGVSLVLGTKAATRLLAKSSDDLLAQLLPVQPPAPAVARVHTEFHALVTEEAKGIPLVPGTSTDLSANIYIESAVAAPGGRVLVRGATSGQPLLVLGRAGRGQVLVALAPYGGVQFSWPAVLAWVARPRTN